MKLNEHRKKLGIALGFLLIGLIAGAAIVYAFTPSFSTYISGGSMASTSRFILWPDQSYYLARNGLTGRVSVDTSFTNLFLWCEDNLGSQGGTIHLMPGVFEGYCLINRDGVTLEGETVFEDTPIGIGDNPPTELYGSVIKVTEAGADGIHISGQRYGIIIRNLGIWFNVTTTGNGITTDMGQTYTLTHATIENIKVLNHDKSHYAIQIANFLHCRVSGILAFGGPLLHLYNNVPYFQAGNSIFDGFYGYIKWDITPIVYAEGPYPIFIHVNDSLPYAGRWINLMNFRRLQINNPVGSVDPNYHTMIVFNLRHSTFQELDLEGSQCGNHTLQLGSCNTITFIDPYMWEADPGDAYLEVSSDNEHITFMGGYLEKVLDSNHTDTYIGTKIWGPIDEHSVCDFVDLPGNAGYAQIENGQSSVTVTAAFIGYNYAVQVTPLVAADNQEHVRVSSFYAAPTNQFTVKTASGNVTTGTVGFYWKVLSSRTPTPPF